MQENIRETRVCRQCGASYGITDIDLAYLDGLSPVIAGERYPLPAPTMCPECRKLQRLAWRIETKLYRRECDLTGSTIISAFPPSAPFRVYEQGAWHGDGWDPKAYGRDFDFTRPFFPQFQDLLLQVPLPSKGLVSCENSDFCNSSTALKSCYLTFNSNTSEDCLYCVDAVRSRDCVDCFGIIQSEHCYECIATKDSYGVRYSYDAKDCRDSSFLLSCIGCSECYGCTDLENAQYRIYNVQYSKEEYLRRVSELAALPMSEQKRKFLDFHTPIYARHHLPNLGSENVSESENAVESRNVSYSRHIFGAQDVRYSQRLQVPTIRYVMDYTGFGNKAEKIYFSQQVGNNANRICFTHASFGEVSDLIYCMYCRNNVQDCFACIGLRNARYCILNKQYSKEEYEALVPRIIGHMRSTGEWGEYFPATLCHNGYNESMCQLLHPLTKQEAISQGFVWSDYEPPFPKVEKIIPAEKLPEDITQIPDDILNWAIECEITKKPYRIIRQELDFYRKHLLPIPRRHPDERYLDRLKWYVNY